MAKIPKSAAKKKNTSRKAAAKKAAKQAKTPEPKPGTPRAKAPAKPAAKKVAAKKAAAPKPAAKKAAKAAKKAAAKKSAKTTARKPAAAKKATTPKKTKPAAKKPATKKAATARKATPKAPKPSSASKAAAKKTTASRAVKPAAKKAQPTKAPAAKKAAAAIAKKAAKPKKASTGKAAAPRSNEKRTANVLSKKEALAKLLSLRAKDTKREARDASKAAQQGKVVPTSVAKAAEFAEARRISTIVHARDREEAVEKPVVKKKRRRRKAPYTKTELRELREILESERQRLVKEIDRLRSGNGDDGGNNRTFSNHQADAATDSSAVETMLVTRRYEEERLTDIVGALERLESGEYGLCEMCADEQQKLCDTCPYIPIGRLRAKPFAKLCVPCRQMLEKKNRQR